MSRGNSRHAERSEASQNAMQPRILRPFGASLLRVTFAVLLLAGCRQKMANQPRYDPLESSDFFADGMSARPRIAGTVARGDLSDNPFLDTGKINGADGDGFPVAVTKQVIERGHERFNIYCSECHGQLGDGNG